MGTGLLRARSRTTTLVWIGALLATSFLLGHPAGAVYDDGQTHLASAGFNSSTHQPAVSPDGRYLVFPGDPDGNGLDEVHTVRLDDDTNELLQVSADSPAPDYHEVTWLQVTPDSSRVLYLRGAELFSAPLDAEGQEIRLSPSADSGYRIAPDGSRVVFTGYPDGGDQVAIYSAPVDVADDWTKLSEDDDGAGDVFAGGWQITPDSSRVVFHGNHRTNSSSVELFSAPIDQPGQQVVVSDVPAGAHGVHFSEATADSSRVVFLGDLTDPGVGQDLYVAPVDGAGPQVKLTSAVAGGQVYHDFSLTSDGDRAVFRGDLEVVGRTDLYSVPVDGSEPQVRLSSDLQPEGDVRWAMSSPDATHAVFVGDLLTDEVQEIFSAPVDGSGSQVRLSPAPVAGGDVWTNDVSDLFSIAPDSSTVVFTGDLVTDGVDELWSAAIDGSSHQRLSDASATGGSVLGGDRRISPDSTRVAFRGYLDHPDVLDLWSVPLGGGDQVKVSEIDPSAGFVNWYAFAPDSSFLVYRGDLEAANTDRLYASGAGQQPSQPVDDLTVDDVTATSATVSWTPPAHSQVTGYEVDVQPVLGRVARATSLAAGATGFTFEGLSPDTDYLAFVVVVNDAGESPASSVLFTTDEAEEPTDGPTDGPTDSPTDGPEEPGGVVRLAGGDRFATAATIALDRFDPAEVETVYLATGRNFPDALAGGPLAVADGAPILLTEVDTLPTPTADALATLDPDRVVALGGTVAIADTTLAAAGTAGTATTSRLAGGDRYATAAAIAEALPSTDTVFLAVGTNFPDALAGGPATAGAPILLTQSGSLPAATQDALAELRPNTIVALGGQVAIENSTLARAGFAAGGAVTSRLAGGDRYATAAAVAETVAGADTVYVAVGTNFPDALAGGPAAAAEGAPIVLVQNDAIPSATQAWLDDLPGLRRVVILGGTTAVDDDVESDLAALLAP